MARADTWNICGRRRILFRIGEWKGGRMGRGRTMASNKISQVVKIMVSIVAEDMSTF